MLETELLVGAIGWNNDRWQNGFYPEDLPEDWRLGYYSNRLRAVLVPASVWDDDQVNPEDWLEDIYPEFRLLLAWETGGRDAVTEAQQFLDRTRSIADNVDAYLVSIVESMNDEMIRAVELLSAHRPVSLIGKDYQRLPEESGLQSVAGVSECWLADEQEKPLARGDFLVVLTSENKGRRVREIIEEIDRWPDTVEGAKGAALFFVGDGAADNAIQARTIVELMGV